MMPERSVAEYFPGRGMSSTGTGFFPGTWSPVGTRSGIRSGIEASDEADGLEGFRLDRVSHGYGLEPAGSFMA